AVREHHRNPGFVVVEDIRHIAIVVREHKMQSVTYVIKAFISTDEGARHKFEIDAVAVPRDGVVHELHRIAMPAMDAVTRLRRAVGARVKRVVRQYAAIAVLTIQPEKGIVKLIVADDHMLNGRQP